MTDLRPRRSVLYMPGSNPRALEKARGLPADGLIFDLEDAVAPEAKDAARDAVVATIRAGGYGERELVIRVNDPRSDLGEADLAAAAHSGAHAVLLPKVQSADLVRQADEILAASHAPETLGIWCMIETPRGILRAEEIAQAGPRVQGFVMGTNDLAKDLRAADLPDRLPLLHSLGHCLLVARAYDLVCLDGVHRDVDDAAGFAAACAQGAAMGFDGKTLIHPKTIAAANAAFGPSDDEVAWARRITAAFEEAAAAGKAVVLVEGKLVEALHVETARRLVALDDAIRRLAAT